MDKIDIVKSITKLGVGVGTSIILDSIVPKEFRKNLPLYKQVCVGATIMIVSACIAKQTDKYIDEKAKNIKKLCDIVKKANDEQEIEEVIFDDE